MPAQVSSRRSSTDPTSKQTPTIFIACSRSDQRWRDQFAEALKSRQVGAVSGYKEDARGERPIKQGPQTIPDANAAVVLVSQSYLDSEAARNDLPYLRAKEKPIFPVLIDRCDWTSYGWLSNLQMFPSDGRPLSSLDPAELNAYVASAAIQIGSLVGVVGAAELASARVVSADRQFAGMATLVNPTSAIGVLPRGEDSNLMLEFPKLGSE